MEKILAEGRKFKALKYAIILFSIVAGMLFTLAILGKEVPLSLGISAGTLASCLPGYLGVNVYQKKIESKEGKNG